MISFSQVIRRVRINFYLLHCFPYFNQFVEGFKDVIYYPALKAYVVLDIKGDNYKLWKADPDRKAISLLSLTKYSSVKFGNFFSISPDGQLLYMNYADKGIQVIDAKSDNFGSFKPSRTINCPQNDEFVQVCPLKVNTQNWLLVATQNGHVCLLDENYETVSSICLNLKLIDLKKEQINCMAVSPNSKNAIVSSQVYCNRA